MPMHPDFKRIMSRMMANYGKEKGKQVFYAWVNEHGFDDTMPMEGQKDKLKKAEDGAVVLLLKDIEKFTELRRLLTDALTIVDSSLAVYDEEPKDVDEAPTDGGHEGNMDMGKHDLGSLIRKHREKP